MLECPCPRGRTPPRPHFARICQTRSRFRHGSIRTTDVGRLRVYASTSSKNRDEHSRKRARLRCILSADDMDNWSDDVYCFGTDEAPPRRPLGLSFCVLLLPAAAPLYPPQTYLLLHRGQRLAVERREGLFERLRIRLLLRLALSAVLPVDAVLVPQQAAQDDTGISSHSIRAKCHPGRHKQHPPLTGQTADQSSP